MSLRPVGLARASDDRPAPLEAGFPTAPSRGRSRPSRASTGSATLKGRVIYVGKAKSLRPRLSSYFQDIGNLHPRTATMVTTAASVEWTTVKTEVEALQLEYSWIKEFDPRFNVKYRDDKSYPWLAVTVGDEYPRVMVGRGAKRKGTRYFGPYGHAWAIRETVDLLLRVFPMRSCSNGVFKRSGQIGRPCLLGYIDKCSAPCVGNVGAEEHRAIVDDFCDFMGGQTTAFVKRVEKEMYAAPTRWTSRRRPGSATTSARSTRRWRSRRWSSATAPTPTWSPWPRTRSRSPSRSSTCAAGGSAASAAGWPTGSTRAAPPSWSTTSCSSCTPAPQRRDPARDPGPGAPARRGDVRGAPRRPARLEGRDPGAAARRQARPCRRRSPNAGQALALHKTKRASDLTTRNRALEEIQDALGLDEVPLRIECYDVSNLQGTEVVASMVVFEDGLARKREYRRFVIRGVDGQNDVASMHEVITRRFRRLLDEQATSTERVTARTVRCWSTPRPGGRASSRMRPGSSWSTAGPAGRRGQRALDELGIVDIPVCGLAKRLEEVWLPVRTIR